MRPGCSPWAGPGRRSTVTVSGGNSRRAEDKARVPARSGRGARRSGRVRGPGWPVLPPMKLVVGEGPDVLLESAGGPSPGAEPIDDRHRAGGRPPRPIARTGTEDRSITVVREEGDADRGPRAGLGDGLVARFGRDRARRGGGSSSRTTTPGRHVQRNGFALNQVAINPDSRLVIEPKADGPVTIEVTDRYGDGGPGLRLSPGSRPVPAGFRDQPAVRQPGREPGRKRRRAPRRAATPGLQWLVNLRPGQTLPINFLITAEGKTGPIEVRAKGSPRA